MTTVVLALGASCATAAFLFLRFRRARAARMGELAARSEVAETRVGPVEFALYDGPGPTILASHGTPGGFDAFWPIEGHRTLVPSRPGYLRTPLASGRTPDEQADAFAALLEHLKPRIGSDLVVLLCASGGAPAALAFAARHPDRTRALVVAMGVSGPISLPSLPSAPGVDLLLWLLGSLVWRVFRVPGVARKFVPDAANRQRLLADADATDQFVQLIGANWPLAPRVEGAMLWAELLIRVFGNTSDPLVCQHCGGRMRLISSIHKADVIQKILACTGEPNAPPELRPARGPPQRDMYEFTGAILAPALRAPLTRRVVRHPWLRILLEYPRLELLRPVRRRKLAPITQRRRRLFGEIFASACRRLSWWCETRAATIPPRLAGDFSPSPPE